MSAPSYPHPTTNAAAVCAMRLLGNVRQGHCLMAHSVRRPAPADAQWTLARKGHACRARLQTAPTWTTRATLVDATHRTGSANVWHAATARPVMTVCSALSQGLPNARLVHVAVVYRVHALVLPAWVCAHWHHVMLISTHACWQLCHAVLLTHSALLGCAIPSLGNAAHNLHARERSVMTASSVPSRIHA